MRTPRFAGVFRLVNPALLGLVLLVSSCARWQLTPPLEPTGTARAADTPATTPTAFQPVTPSPTPGVLTLWIAPAVPDELRAALKAHVEQGAGRIRLVNEPQAALLRFEPEPDLPLSTWVYALVTRFPSTLEGLTAGELGMRWYDSEQQGGPVYLAPDTLPAIETRLGSPPGPSVHTVPTTTLLTLNWYAQDSLSIVPFELLEPRWKVLPVDGWSPLERSQPPDDYPLQVTFGLSGPGALRAEAAQLLAPPSGNRDLERMTVVLMTGVTALTRATAWQMERNGVDYPAELVRDWLLEADLTHISNEVSFLANCPYPDPSQAGLHFCAAPKYLELLQWIGVDLVELTGNHGNDYGTQAFDDTLQVYHEQGWYTFGGGADLADSLQPVLLEHHGNKLAFLGCNIAGPTYAWATASSPGAAPCEPELYDTLGELREQGFITIFTYQWSEHASVNALQREGFRRAVDAGADIVSGSQAHQPQGFEFYHGSFIHYGLGNLFFDQMQTLAMRQEFLDRHVFYDGRHISTELLTALLENYAQPRPMTSGERAAFLEQMFRDSGW